MSDGFRESIGLSVEENLDAISSSRCVRVSRKIPRGEESRTRRLNDLDYTIGTSSLVFAAVILSTIKKSMSGEARAREESTNSAGRESSKYIDCATTVQILN